MKLWYRNHHYKTQFFHNVKQFFKWRYKHPKEWDFLNLFGQYYVWFGHEDDCCDYWMPVHLPDGSINPKVKRALMLDDELGLVDTTPTTEESK